MMPDGQMSGWKETGKKGELYLVDKHGQKHYKIEQETPQFKVSMNVSCAGEMKDVDIIGVQDLREQKVSVDTVTLEDELKVVKGLEPPGEVFDTMDTSDFKIKVLPRLCDRCKAEIKEFEESETTGRPCHNCGQYQPAPNETFDISKVDFKLPQIFNVPAARPMAMTPHDDPIPWCSNSEIASNHDVNEKVFNRLPLTEDQKWALKEELEGDIKKEMKERVKEKRDETRMEQAEEINLSHRLRAKEREVREKTRTKKERGRRGVKESLPQTST